MEYVEKRYTVNKPIRVYADTSVFGGFFDEEFSEPKPLEVIRYED